MKMKEGIIYKATNVATGEVYIGATTISLHERINDHYNKATKNCGHKFQNAIREYGFESFIILLLSWSCFFLLCEQSLLLLDLNRLM